MIKKHFVFKTEDIANCKYSVWELIQPLWFTVSIYDGIDVYNENLSRFTQGQRRMFALVWYDSEVSNGGHEQFFGNSTGIVWKDALEGMRMIQADSIADNFQKAIDLFGGEVPFDRYAREEKLDELYESDDFDGFDEIDRYYFERTELVTLMNKYVTSHPQEFAVDGIYDYDE